MYKLKNNYKILLIFLIIFIILSLKYIKNKEKFLNNNQEWNKYRLSDIVKYWNDIRYENNKYDYINSIKSKYKNSIGDIYLKKNTKKKKNNYSLLKNILDEKSKFTRLPDKNDIILHLRIGDSLKDYINGNFIYNKNYATRIEKIEKLHHLISNKRVIIIYGQHQDYSNMKLKKINDIYLEKIRDIFRKNNINFKERLSGNPDEDFIYMSNAKIFIKSGGGYSNLISKMVEMNKNQVIDPSKL